MYLPNDGDIKISTTLGNGLKDSFILKLNNFEVILENYFHDPSSNQLSLKTQGEYLLINKNFEERIFKIRRFIYDKDHIVSILPLNGRFMIEYSLIQSKNINNNHSSEAIYLDLNVNKRELREGGEGDEGGGDLKTHGIGCYIVWSILSYLMFLSGRYMRYFYKWRMIFHVVLGIAILILSIVFVSMGNGRTRNSNTFGNMHKGLAALTFPWLIFELISGGVVKFAHFSLVHNSWIAVWCRIIHMWTSYGCIIANNAIVLSGIYAYGSSTATLMYYHWGVMIILSIAIEIVSRFSSKWRYSNVFELKKRNLQEITMDRFLTEVKGGRKLALFDDYIVDLGNYGYEHPGGNYVLTEWIGWDLGKYFYGSYSMENWIKPVTHSRVAGRILFKLICGKIAHHPDAYQIFSPINDYGKGKINGTTFMFKVKEKTEITKDIWRVVFENKNLNIKKFYRGLSLAGRGFIISSPKNQVSRYYTIWNWMGSKIYDEYLSAFMSCTVDHLKDLIRLNLFGWLKNLLSQNIVKSFFKTN